VTAEHRKPGFQHLGNKWNGWFIAINGKISKILKNEMQANTEYYENIRHEKRWLIVNIKQAINRVTTSETARIPDFSLAQATTENHSLIF